MQKLKNNTRLIYILCWLLHLRYLNRVVDNIYLKSHILSLYFYYNPSHKNSRNIKEIYLWFRKYFKTYYLPNNYWIYKFKTKDANLNHINTTKNWNEIYNSLFSDEIVDLVNKKCLGNKQILESIDVAFENKLKEINQFVSTSNINKYDFFLGLIVKRSISSVLTGKCGAEISNIIFASLLRSLGHYSRITMFIPPNVLFKKRPELNDNDRRPELWVEAFDPSFNKWISIDIHRGGWNFTNCKPTSNISINTQNSNQNFKIERKSQDVFSKLFLNQFEEDDDSDEDVEIKNKNSPLPVIPLKKKCEKNYERLCKYLDSSEVEQSEQIESLAFEFSNSKKLEALTLAKLQAKIDISKTNIKYRTNENIGWWIISVNEFGFLKETTPRYFLDYSLVTQSQLKNSNRQKFEFLISILNNKFQNYKSRMLQLEILDEFELEKLTFKNDDVIPTSKTLFKNHPKYALLSCLNSLEIIHPKEPILGYFQGEPIYPRENVHILKTRLQWEQNQREIKPNQQPIKVITKKKLNIESKKQEYFAEYQTQIKPISELNYLDQIPTDRYKSINVSIKGNLPDSCIHIKDESIQLEEISEKSFVSRYYHIWKIKSLFEIVKNSDLDYARAFIGYDFKNKSKPQYDGLVIKKENINILDSLKKKRELININKIANIIWNDMFQKLKNILNDVDLSITDEIVNSNARNSKDVLNTNYNIKKIKNLSEKLFSESLSVIEETNKKRLIER